MRKSEKQTAQRSNIQEEELKAPLYEKGTESGARLPKKPARRPSSRPEDSGSIQRHRSSGKM